MAIAFPDAVVTGYEGLCSDLKLPDPKDVHVVAAAVKGRCDVIVTFNKKDFPDAVLEQFDVDVQHPDEFLNHHLSLESSITLQVIKQSIADKKKPALTVEEYLRALEKVGLVTFAESLREVSALLK